MHSQAFVQRSSGLDPTHIPSSGLCHPKEGVLHSAAARQCACVTGCVDSMLTCRAGPSICAFSGAPQHPRATPQPAPVSPITAPQAFTPGCGLPASSTSPPHSTQDPSEPPRSCNPYPLRWPGQQRPPPQRGPAHACTPSRSPSNRQLHPGSASEAAGPDPTGCCQARCTAEPSLQLCYRATVAPAPTAYGAAAWAEQRRQHPCQPPRAAERSRSHLRG